MKKKYYYEFDGKMHLKRMKEHYYDNRPAKLEYSRNYYQQEKVTAKEFIKENEAFIQDHIEKRPSKIVKLVKDFTKVTSLQDRIRVEIKRKFKINLDGLKVIRKRKYNYNPRKTKK